MVAERAIVSMLLDSHDLDGIVAQRADTREHVCHELPVAVHFGLLAGHAHMALVDTQRTWPTAEEISGKD